MKLEDISKIVGGTPNMMARQAMQLRKLFGEYHLRNVLELGFAHGVSTCYLAAILDEFGGGSITTIDLESARRRQPNIEDLLKRCGYDNHPAVAVSVLHEPTSYVWRLMKFLEQDPVPKFDFCYLDAAHSWFVDGFGFFLVDRLLRSGGWIVLDDLFWTFGKSIPCDPAMPHEERDTAQVSRVYDLLVKPHPYYGDFRVQDGWGYAHKLRDTQDAPVETRTEVVFLSADELVRRYASAAMRRLSGLFRRW